MRNLWVVLKAEKFALTKMVYIALLEAIKIVSCLQSLAGTEECADDFFKLGAECLCHSLVVVHIKHDQWQTSFIWENLA